jgi:O-antigen ligase
MNFALLLWLLVWAGMFTDTRYIQPPYSEIFLSDFKTFFQGTRAFFPHLATYLTLMWIIIKRAKFPYLKNPLGFLFAYGFIGLSVSFLLSTEPWESAYWAGLYLAPLMVFWMVTEGEDNFHRLKVTIQLNYAVFFALTFSLLPSAVRIGRGAQANTQLYAIPFGLGDVTRNGVGRYALIVIIVSVVRLAAGHGKMRWAWLVPLPPAFYMLAQTESRTSLLGLALVMMFFVLLKGINFKFFLVGLAALAIIYISGFQGRAQSNFERLLDLSGRQVGWSAGIDRIEASPFLGWGFNADRIMLRNLHMHNSYLHAAIQEGIVGALLFLASLAGIWIVMLKKRIFKVTRSLEGEDQVLLTESVLIVVFLTSRTFFESTAAFYGVDLLLLVPAMAFISFMLRRSSVSDSGPEVIL